VNWLRANNSTLMYFVVVFTRYCFDAVVGILRAIRSLSCVNGVLCLFLTTYIP